MTEAYSVEQGPPPPNTQERKYPFASMAVGECFYFPSADIQLVHMAKYDHAKRTGKKFTATKHSDRDEQGCCWRIE